MRGAHWLTAITSVVVFMGCSTQTVRVEIHPDFYQVGNVTSELATPAVDEVVRINPQAVITVFCLTTPPAKVRQFVDEIRARSKAEVKGETPEKCDR